MIPFDGRFNAIVKEKVMIIPCIDDTKGPWLHAVDWPIGDSGGVANADGESSIVGSDQVDGGPLCALNLERRPFATIFGETFARSWNESNGNI